MIQAYLIDGHFRVSVEYLLHIIVGVQICCKNITHVFHGFGQKFFVKSMTSLFISNSCRIKYVSSSPQWISTIFMMCITHMFVLNGLVKSAISLLKFHQIILVFPQLSQSPQLNSTVLTKYFISSYRSASFNP